jgi:phosphoribosyl 1,2-cyclic phosphate phosphodiesterase
MDDIRPFNFKQGPMPIYAHQRVLENLAKRFDYIFATENRYPGAPAVAINEVTNNQDFYVKRQKITPINAFHGNLQVFGYKINDFVYLTDVKTIASEELDKINESIKNIRINMIYQDSEDEFNYHLKNEPINI